MPLWPAEATSSIGPPKDIAVIEFKDPTLQQQFDHDGFVVTDLLDASEVRELREAYFNLRTAHLTVEDKMHSTNDTGNLELVLEVDRKLQAVILPKVNSVLESYEPLLGSFLVKETGDGSETGFHQDPTMVEEQEYVSANVWVALQDTDSQNGNLRVVKGSHRMIDSLITTPNCPVSYASFRHRLVEFSTEVPVKAGQAIFINHKMIHGATANHSSEERIAAVIAIKSKMAKWRFLYLEPGDPHDRIEAYRIGPRSFASLLKNQRPTEAEFLGHISHDFKQMSEKDFVAFMRQGGPRGSLRSRASSLLRNVFSKQA